MNLKLIEGWETNSKYNSVSAVGLSTGSCEGRGLDLVSEVVGDPRPSTSPRGPGVEGYRRGCVAFFGILPFSALEPRVQSLGLFPCGFINRNKLFINWSPNNFHGSKYLPKIVIRMVM